MTAIRSYQEKDVKRLIAAAGGRCSYRHDGEICKRLLVNNNSVIGEKAHIIAISKKGPRYDKGYDFSNANTYENLMWMCPTHHTIIDKMADVNIYTESMLKKMKNEHEYDIRIGNLSNGTTLYDTIIHDYSVLSTLFEYVDINKLYSSSLDLPNTLGYEFTDLLEMLDAYEEGNGKFYLKDKYLNKLFNKTLESTNNLWRRLTETFDIEPVNNSPTQKTSYRCRLSRGKTFKDIQWIEYWVCCYQESVEIFLNAMKLRYPEIFCQPVYEPFQNT